MSTPPEPQKEEQRPDPEQITDQPEEQAAEQEPETAERWRNRLHLPTPEQLKTFQEERKHLPITYTTDSLHISHEGLMNIESILLDMHDYNRAHTRLIHDLERRAERTEEEPAPPRLTPDPQEVKQLELELPAEWSQPLEPGQHQEMEIHLDIALRRYAQMSDQELATHLDLPRGDIDENAKKAVQELDLDVQAILSEEPEPSQKAAPAQEPTPRNSDPHSPEHTHQDDDFGR